jgi:hypothetical protein
MALIGGKLPLRNGLQASSTVGDACYLSVDADQTARVALHKKLTE